MNLNQAMLVGRLTRDPEMRTIGSETNVTSMSIATNSSYKNGKGEKMETTEFHNVVVFGNVAKTCAQYLQKGQEVMVRGRIQTRSWDDPTSGEKKYRTEIIADSVQFGSKPSYDRSAGGAPGASGSSENASGDDVTPTRVADPSKPAKKAVAAGSYEYPTDDINPEDIPF